MDQTQIILIIKGLSLKFIMSLARLIAASRDSVGQVNGKKKPHYPMEIHIPNWNRHLKKNQTGTNNPRPLPGTNPPPRMLLT